MSRVRSHARLSIGAFCLHILLSLTGSFAFSQGGVITTFSGVVKQKDGTVVVHAPIQLTVGQDVPQTTFSDSRGAFHVEVPSSARSLHISIYAPGFEVFEGDLNIRRTGPEIIYLQKLATKLANGGSASRTTAKDQAPSLTTYGDKSPIVTGNGSSVIYNDAPDPDKPYIRYLPDGETKTVSGGGSKIILNSGEVMEWHSMDVLIQQKKWRELVFLAEKEKAKELPWYTPYFFAGVGYGYLCMLPEAEENFATFVQKASEIDDYEDIVSDANRNLAMVRQAQTGKDDLCKSDRP